MVVGAKNLRDRLGVVTDVDKERAQKLIEALRGDELFKGQGKYAAGSSAPHRRVGSYLPEYDKKKIKKFLVGLMGGGTEEPATQEEDK